jgi:hypothetical protein
MKTNVLIRFDGDDIPGGVDAILGPCQCGPDVAEVKKFSYGNGTKTTVKVWLTLDERDERVAQVLALLAPYGEGEIAYRTDEYTEEELQNARLLYANTWGKDQVGAGKHYGTTYDVSNACKQCGTGVRQTSPLVIHGEDERRIEKMHVAGTYHGDFLVPDVLGEKLAKANLTGLNLWRAYSSRKSGPNVELRREQIFAENVLPPMAPSSLLDRKEVCPVCQRGRYNFVFREPPRIVYRAEDLKNIQDVNLTWEWFGSFAKTPEDAVNGLWPDPLLLVTPKVMNLLRGKTKKEKKYEGVSFTPIWIEGEEPRKT